VRFVHGMIYSHRGMGGHALYGPILRRWRSAGSVGSRFGYPTSSVFSIRGGVKATFRHGSISWDRSSHRYTVRHR
jgi:uncharacterized protein with LGFP repeats